VHAANASAQLLRLNWPVRAGVVEAKLRELDRAVKANQPRLPAGNPGGGQWTSGGGGGVGSRVAQNFPRGGRSTNREIWKSQRLLKQLG
jgi:hypothetical protein